MHSSIWVEHDGSWTWSIEDGKAFEDDHRVLARNDGYASRGDAKDAMQESWARLLEQGEKPGRPGQATPTRPAAAPLQAPEWAVIVAAEAGDRIVALLADERAALGYAQTLSLEDYRVERMRVAIVAR